MDSFPRSTANLERTEPIVCALGYVTRCSPRRSGAGGGATEIYRWDSESVARRARARG